MSYDLDAFEALALIPDWDFTDCDVEELRGGLTNRTYRVRQGENEYVLRLDAMPPGLLQLDRASELLVLPEAAKAGLAPSVIHADMDAGILLTEFIQGKVWNDADIRSPARLEVLADLLRRVHALPLCGNRLDASKVSRAYQEFLGKGHDLHIIATRCVEVIDQIPVNDGSVCCHNDIVAANVIENGRIVLIDWEFACDNDPMFDLASAIGFHNLDEQSADILLDAYAGSVSADLKERLAEQCSVYDAIQWLWLASRQLVFPSRAQSNRLKELQQRIR